MSKFFLSLFIVSSTLLAAAPQNLPPPSVDPKLLIDELSLLNNLIEVTEQNLINQKKLRELTLAYQVELGAYLKNSNDKDLVLQVAKTANKLLTEIKKNHLIESFQVNFISELTLFSQLSQKRGIPKP